MSELTFMDQLLEGQVLPEDIDDYIDRWSDDTGHAEELHEFLGMTWDEYALWAERPSSLRYIAAARIRHRSVRATEAGEAHSLSDYKTSRKLAAVARAAEEEAAVDVLDWLRRTGRVPD